MRDEQKLVTIVEFENAFDAELSKVTLENVGIESIVVGEDVGTIKPFSTNVKLQVFEKDIERAKEVLAEKTPLDSDEVAE
jgi:4-alpha-glucanotransferase